jgi:outer membrane protein insertion porin family
MKRVRTKINFALWVWMAFSVAAANAVNVRDVRVEQRGPGALDESSVLSFVSVKPGDPYNPHVISRDLRLLQETGRFSLINAEVLPHEDAGEVTVIFAVRNKPRLVRLSVEGADYLSNRKVRELLDLTIGDVVDDADIAVRAQAVYEHYRKRYFTNPRLTWTLNENEEEGTVEAQITVNEGKRAGVWRIYFDGNKKVPDRPLRKVMSQGVWRPWSWLSKGNIYNPFDLESDREALRKVYMDRGHLDARIEEPVVEEKSRKLVNITIPIDEGPVYRVGDVQLEGVTLFPYEDVRRVLRLQPGDVLSWSEVERDRQDLRDYFGSRGYIGTISTVTLEPALDKPVADLLFEVREGQLAYIRDIRIRGNQQTKDKVLRRELAVRPGEIFDEVRVRRSENRLRNMGLFQQVRSYPDRTDREDVYDLTFEVEEARTGQLTAGVGFSSIDDVVGFAEIAQNNFDLFGAAHGFTGGGQKAKLRTQVGSSRTDVELSFVEPWFLDRQLALEIDLFRSDKSFLSSDYDQRNIGGVVGLSHAVGRFSRLKVSYGFEEITIRNVATNASEIIRAEEGTRTKSSMTLTYIFDTRDNFFIPTRGNRSVLSGMVAGGPVLQGETDIYMLDARTSHYVPLWFDHVFSLRGRAAVVEPYGDSDRVPIFDRLFLGGARDVRGFRFRDVGPKDEFGEPIGGNTTAFVSAEYTVPVVENIRLAGFYDIGMVWDEAYTFETGDLNSAVGVGIRFDIPGFPLRFDYAWPLETDVFNDRDSGRFSFMIGHVL